MATCDHLIEGAMRFACRSVRHIYEIRVEEPIYSSLFPASSSTSTDHHHHRRSCLRCRLCMFIDPDSLIYTTHQNLIDYCFAYCINAYDLCSLFHENRKHCVACKCPREAHDVTHHESVNVHDRLGLSKEPGQQQQQQDQQLPASSARVMPLSRGRPTSSDVYSWIPAGIPLERVSRNPFFSNSIIYHFAIQQFT